jgi:hypothetical protein
MISKPMVSMVIAAVCLAANAASAQESEKPQYGAWGVDLTATDPRVKPGDDLLPGSRSARAHLVSGIFDTGIAGG